MNIPSEMDQDAAFVANELACMTRLQLTEILIKRREKMYILAFVNPTDESVYFCEIKMVEMASRSLDSIVEIYFDILIDSLDDFGGK